MSNQKHTCALRDSCLFLGVLLLAVNVNSFYTIAGLSILSGIVFIASLSGIIRFLQSRDFLKLLVTLRK
jgi:hypothetical protein